MNTVNRLKIPPAPKSIKTDIVRLTRPKWIRLALYGMAVIVFAGSIFNAYQGARLNQILQQQIRGLESAGIIAGDSITPASTPPSLALGDSETNIPSELPSSNWVPTEVPANRARSLRIPEIGVDSYVHDVGIVGDAVDTPNNIFNVGWYTGSSQPNSAGGAAFMVGHVSGPSLPGVFKRIGDLSQGSSIEIELGDGRVRKFTVTEIIVAKATDIDMSKTITSADSSKFGLNLMTCGGNFNVADWAYDDRVLVRAVEV